MNEENIIKLEEALVRLYSNDNTIYFLVYDTKNNARASVKYIYDTALTLKDNGHNVKLLVEDKSYTGVKGWLGDKYDTLEQLIIKEMKVGLNVDDVIVIPEYFSNVLEQLSHFKCTKVLLVQQKEYIFENLPIGSRWSDFGFDRVITTTESAKKYIHEYFPESLVFVIPPIIDDIFKPSDKLKKPHIAISCRDRLINRKLISEFYLKFPQFRWFAFKDMVQLSYEEFAVALQDCMVSLWVDDESTFGTFPIESMKSGVTVVGKIPRLEPDWLGDNGMWSYDTDKLVDILGSYVAAWVDGVELNEEAKEAIKTTISSYDNETIKNNIVSVFNSFKNTKIEAIKKGLEKLKQIEE